MLLTIRITIYYEEKLCWIIIFWTLLPLNANAWGEKGHQLVAEIAFKQLDKKPKTHFKLFRRYVN